MTTATRVLGEPVPAVDFERIALALERIATALEQRVLEEIEAHGVMTEAGLPTDEPPFPVAPPPEYAPTAPLPPRPQNGNAVPPQPQGLCPEHHKPWSKLVPAGVSKSSGKPFSAFWACPEQGCRQRAPR